jgi:signal transduction histidine kinase
MAVLNEDRNVPVGDDDAENPQLLEALSRVKSLELELEKSRTQLAERTRRLQELSSFRDQLNQMLAHDLRSPLTGITGHLDLAKMLMQRDAGREKTGLLINRAQESTRRLEALVTDIVDLGRLQENRRELKITDVDLRGLFVECCGSFESLADLEEKRILVDVQEGIPAVPADRDVLGRVVANLLQNSLNFTPVGGEIRLAACRDHSSILIEVTPGGEGFPGESSNPGYGLGLTFCRLAAEAHGGLIRVEPACGGGSRFVLELGLTAGQTGGGSE